MVRRRGVAATILLVLGVFASALGGGPPVTKAAAPFACPVTPYTDSRPRANVAGFTPTWFGNGAIWAGLDPGLDGVWLVGNQKVLWWRSLAGTLTVSGRRLDAPAPRLGGKLPGGAAPAGIFEPSRLDFPTPGCWEVTARLASSTLRFVVRVVPEDAHPLYRAALAAQRALQPYPAPAACPVTPWAAPSRRGFDAFLFWLDGHGLALGQQDGVLFAGEDTVSWLPDRGLEPALTFQRLDGPAPAPQVVTADQITELGASWVSWITFPRAGCWRLHAQAGAQTLAATLYVYPSACRATGARRAAACALPSVQRQPLVHPLQPRLDLLQEAGGRVGR